MTIGDQLDTEFEAIRERFDENESTLRQHTARLGLHGQNIDDILQRLAALESGTTPPPDPEPEPEPPTAYTPVGTAAELNAAILVWSDNSLAKPIRLTADIEAKVTIAGPERSGLVLDLGGHTLWSTNGWPSTITVTDGANGVTIVNGTVEIRGNTDGRAIIQGATWGHRNTDGLLLKDLVVRSGDWHGCAVQTFGPAGGGILDLDNVRIEPIAGQYMARYYRWGGHGLGVFKINRDLPRPMRWHKLVVTGVRQHVASTGIGANCATDGNAVHAGDLCTGTYSIDITDSSFTDADGGGVILYQSPKATVNLRRSTAQRCGLLTGPAPYCTATAALQSDSGLITYDAASNIQSVKGNVRKVG